ncbi:hypothetical protein [Streptomyces sp. NPDC048710]|uniref:hypothetical protein n=1 Tax=Streptomyces sp. NPDC048710 TaxID=3365586 RepID=UPI003722B889
MATALRFPEQGEQAHAQRHAHTALVRRRERRCGVEAARGEARRVGADPEQRGYAEEFPPVSHTHPVRASKRSSRPLRWAWRPAMKTAAY